MEVTRFPQTTFCPAAYPHKLYPSATYSAFANANLNNYFELVTLSNVPTIRSYLSFFSESKASLLDVVQEPTLQCGDSPHNYSRSQNFSDFKHSDLGFSTWGKHSSYSHVNTDNGAPRYTVSHFRRQSITPGYAITRRFEIEEENAICDIASLGNCTWTQTSSTGEASIPKKVTINKVIENQSASPGQNQTKHLQSEDGQRLQILAKYFAELNEMHQRSTENRRNTLFRLSKAFPVFDFVIFDDSGTNASFISLKTGSRDTHQKWYQVAADLYAPYLGLNTHNWFVWATSLQLQSNPNTMVCSVPEDIFDMSVEKISDYWTEKINTA